MSSDCSLRRTIEYTVLTFQQSLGPPVITLSTTPGTNYALQPKSSGSNRADITILSQNVTLEVNLEGRWKLGNVPLETGNLTEIELFTKNSAGLYMFHVTSWDNSEVVAIQIEISAVGKLINIEMLRICNFEVLML